MLFVQLMIFELSVADSMYDFQQISVSILINKSIQSIISIFRSLAESVFFVIKCSKYHISRRVRTL